MSPFAIYCPVNEPLLHNRSRSKDDDDNDQSSNKTEQQHSTHKQKRWPTVRSAHIWPKLGGDGATYNTTDRPADWTAGLQAKSLKNFGQKVEQ